MTKRLVPFISAMALFASIVPASAQQEPEIRRIGFLSVYAESDRNSRHWQQSFEEGLGDHGWIVGKNISIQRRWIRGRQECRLRGRRACIPALVDELLAQNVELIVVHGGLPAQVIQRKNRSLPVVMAEVSDAVGRGIVSSLASPGGSITGVTSLTPVLATKRLELLKAVVPGLRRVGVLWTPDAPASTYAWKEMHGPAQRLGLELLSVEIRRTADLDGIFGRLAGSGAGALISTSGVGSTFGLKRITELATRTRLPAIFTDPEHVGAGGLLAYNRDNKDLYRRAAWFVDRILRGAKPADLPIEQPTRFYLHVNLKTARALGITIPRSIMLLADRVIE